MTLILAVATKRFAVLVADRRITTSDRGMTVDQDDTDTKSAYIDGRYIMGFAGLARLGPEEIRVEQWLTEDALGGYSGDDYFEVLAEATGEALERFGYWGLHAFLAVGFNRQGQPEIVLVSNYHLPDGSTFRPRLIHAFNVVKIPSDWDYMWTSVGTFPLSESENGYLERKIRRSVGAEAPIELVRAMLKVLREASHRSDGRIGTAAIVTVLPLTAVPVEMSPTFISCPTDAELMTFRFPFSFSVPDEARPTDGRVYLPAIWSRVKGKSAYGFRTLITRAEGQADRMVEMELDDFDRSDGDLTTTMEGFPPGIFGDFPRHPAP